MKEEEIKIFEKDIEKANENLQGLKMRAERIYAINRMLLKPKGIISKRCPLCGKQLNKLRLYSIISPLMVLRYYRCECGYEYTTKI